MCPYVARVVRCPKLIRCSDAVVSENWPNGYVSIYAPMQVLRDEKIDDSCPIKRNKIDSGLMDRGPK